MTEKNKMNNKTTDTAPKTLVQVAHHLKFVSSTAATKFKTKALTALTKIPHKPHTTVHIIDILTNITHTVTTTQNNERDK